MLSGTEDRAARTRPDPSPFSASRKTVLREGGLGTTSRTWHRSGPVPPGDPSEEGGGFATTFSDVDLKTTDAAWAPIADNFLEFAASPM
jgi:hypothetical protein